MEKKVLSIRVVVVVVLPDPFRVIGARRNSAETQQSGHTPRSGPKIENRQRGAKDRFAKGIRSRTVEEEMIEVLQRVSTGITIRILLSTDPVKIRR